MTHPDFEYLGEIEGKHCVREQLQPESRGCQVHSFTTHADVELFLAGKAAPPPEPSPENFHDLIRRFETLQKAAVDIARERDLFKKRAEAGLNAALHMKEQLDQFIKAMRGDKS